MEFLFFPLIVISITALLGSFHYWLQL